MQKIELKVCNSYIAKDPYSNRNVTKFTVLEITKTSINIRYESGNTFRYVWDDFYFRYKVIEDLGGNILKELLTEKP